MGLFKRKEKVEKLDQKKRNQNALTSFDKIEYMVIKTASDEQVLEISDKILAGYPVLANFENLDKDEANKLLAFVSGVLYAMDGKILKIQVRMFLLARKEEFEDGTLYQYYEDLK